jgi:DNA-binding winged helix-turn-helix (wHTH) protein
MSAAVMASRPKPERLAPPSKPYVFPPFRLDPAERCLWHGPGRVPLTLKSFAVLLHLIENAGKVVSKEELLGAVWPSTFVGDAVLKVCIAELRKALGDTTQNPSFIQTLHRLGYRFVGRFEANDRLEQALLEREGSLDQLRAALKTASGRKPQVVFVSGEAGIGKTMLVEAFLRELRLHSAVRIAQAHCLDQYGPGEPYFALLEALGSLTSQTGPEPLAALLKQHAPTWLAEMPSLIHGMDWERLNRETIGAAQGRMLRELGALLEALTVDLPLVLLIEDLHWSDSATIDAIAHLARRQCLRILLICTYRPDEAILRDHPLKALKQDLRFHGHCTELALEYLTEAGIAAYLGNRFDGCEWAEALAALIQKRTDGNPLLMVNVIDLLLSRGTIRPNGVGWELRVAEGGPTYDIPESVQEMVEYQLARSSAEEQALLKAASIAGPEFSAGALAAALGAEADILGVEERCHRLARRGRWLAAHHDQDGVFRFVHELYQRALRRTVSSGQRIQLHLRIARFLEAASPKGANPAELAWHWEEGRAPERAIPGLIECARLAARRHAGEEALAHLQRASSLLEVTPREARLALEGAILEQRGLILRSMNEVHGAAANFQQLEAFARANGNHALEVRALLRLSAVLFWWDQDGCLDAARRAVQLSRSIGDPDLIAQAAGYLSSRVLRLKGWNDQDFANCVQAVDAARRLLDPDLLGLHLMSLANFCSSRTEYDEACRAADEGMHLAASVGDAYHYISCEYFKAWALLHTGRWGAALELVRDGIRISQSNGHQTAATYCRVLEAWLHLEAFDVENAARLADLALSESPAGLVRILALIIAARAASALDRLDRASQYLEEVDRRRSSMDWAYNFPLFQARGELCLAQADWRGAGAAADELTSLALESRQETYLGIAQAIRLEAALGEGSADPDQTGVPLEARGSPLAGWRLHEMAARVAESHGLYETAQAHRYLSREALDRLSQSMAAKEPLAVSVRGKINLSPTDPPVLPRSNVDLTTSLRRWG